MVLSPAYVFTVAILAQGTSWAVAATQAFFARVQLCKGMQWKMQVNYYDLKIIYLDSKGIGLRFGREVRESCPCHAATNEFAGGHTVVENTGSLLTSQVKRHKARLVLGWGTAWEDLRVLSAFCF